MSWRLIYRVPIYAIRVGLVAPIVFAMMVLPEGWIQSVIDVIPKRVNEKLGLSFNSLMDFLEGC